MLLESCPSATGRGTESLNAVRSHLVTPRYGSLACLPRRGESPVQDAVTKSVSRGIVPMAWWDAVCALVATTATRLACAGLSRKNEQRLDAEADREVSLSSCVSL